MKSLPPVWLRITLHLVALCVTETVLGQETESELIRFNDQIRPILSEYCFACHGPDAASRKADLRLDRRDSAVDSGAVVPGEATQSELIARITSDDPDVVMPPPDFRKTLTLAQRQLLARWINTGGEWQEHWSFIPPQRPQVPSASGKWARNAIDRFILAELTKHGLTPNAQADRYSLARRTALDLTGLPPTPEMLDAFVNDTEPQAFERYVDRLLASEHAGEHRARYWLDAARYGDTHGMHVDNYREIWPYRDWVVNAFNTNMPFDRFVVEQLAGDLLPEATLDQQIATGFSRCNITTSEGGAIPEEVAVRYMVDRVETTATVFLALTAGCAVCHDHKYDPISQHEFYQLGAFFNNTTQPAMDGNQKDTPPVVTLPADEYRDEWGVLQTQRSELRRLLTTPSNSAKDWWPNRSKERSQPVSEDNLLLSLPLTAGENGMLELPESATPASGHPAGSRGYRFGDKSGFSVETPTLRSDQPLSVSFWMRTPDRLLATTVFDRTTQTSDRKTAGWKINSSTQGALTFEMHDGTGKRIRALLPGDEALTPRAWQHVCVRYSGGQSNSSISILVNGRSGVLRNSTEDLIDATDLPATPLKIATRMPTAGLSDVRIFQRWITDEEVQLLAHDYQLAELLVRDVGWSKLTPGERKLAGNYLHAVIDELSADHLAKLAATQRRRDFIYARSTTTLVMQERPSPPRAWVLTRGEYDQREDEVAPGVPQVLPPLSDDVPRNRLGLARWLVQPDHPLTARVMVNRLWQSVFGTGLVKTSEDFGVMGDRPSHPELLDWLAVEFVESDWNVNHIIKLIVTSAAYRQSSAVSSDKLAADPENRLIAHGPRLRLDAEVLRDQALAVSGLLRRTMGGPSVKPYQPAGLWKVVAITGSNTRVFTKDSGDALYRRSLYTFWKRTSPPPSMAAFNAPTREQCTVRRERTNTPIQALVLLNDPQMVEAARHLAARAIRTADSDRVRTAWMLRTTLSRPADNADVNDVLAVLPAFRRVFSNNDESANALITTGDSKPDASIPPSELATWTMIANTLMNRDDFINK